MRKIGFAVFLTLAAVALVAPLTHAATIENASSSGTVAVNLPGIQTSTGTYFTGSVTLRGVDFSSGAVLVQPALEPALTATKEGRRVMATADEIDLDGSEGSISALSYSGSIFVPATTGPATVTVTASGSASSTAATAATAVGGQAFSASSISLTGVHLGGGFSTNYLDVQGGSANTLRMNEIGSAAGCVADVALASVNNVATQVEQTSADASLNLTTVDAANGLVGFSSLGSISSSTPSGGGPTPIDDDGGPQPVEPNQAFGAPLGGPFSGLGLLLLGLSGAYATVRQPRRRRQLVPSTA